LLVKNKAESSISTFKKSNSTSSQAETEFRSNMLEQMKKFRPSNTIFETGNSAKNEIMSQMMSQKRAKHSELIAKYKLKQENKNALAVEEEIKENENHGDNMDMIESSHISDKKLELSSQQDIESAFGGNVVQPKAITNAKVFKSKKQKRKSNSNEAKVSKVSTKDTKLYRISSKGSSYRSWVLTNERI